MAVEDGTARPRARADRELVEGSVNATLDALVFETDEVTIVGEVVHPVRHCLIARERLPLEQITGSSPIRRQAASAHGSCASDCPAPRSSRPPAQRTLCSIVAESDRPWAALGTRLAAELYGCVVLEEGVEDQRGETKRASSGSIREAARRKPPDGRGGRPLKTSIVFWGLPDSPGSLVAALQEFAGRGMNLSKIESRPRKQGLGRYVFFADLEGVRTTRDRRGLAAVRRRSRPCACSAATRPRADRAARRSGGSLAAGYTFGERSGSRDRKRSCAGGARREPRRRAPGIALVPSPFARERRANPRDQHAQRGRAARAGLTAAGSLSSTPPTSH